MCLCVHTAGQQSSATSSIMKHEGVSNSSMEAAREIQTILSPWKNVNPRVQVNAFDGDILCKWQMQWMMACNNNDIYNLSLPTSCVLLGWFIYTYTYGHILYMDERQCPD